MIRILSVVWSFAFGMFLILGTVCRQGRGDEHREAVRQLTNHDITWTGGFFGLIATKSDRAQQVYDTLNEVDIKTLLAFTEDKDRFVVAHVLLADALYGDATVDENRHFILKVDLYLHPHRVEFPEYEPKKFHHAWAKLVKNREKDIPRLLKQIRDDVERPHRAPVKPTPVK